LEWLRFRSARARGNTFEGSPTNVSPRWRKFKNVALLLIVSAALFGNLSLLVLGPLTLLTRAMTTAVIPVLNHAFAATERALYAAPPLQSAIDWIEGWLRGPVLPVKQPVFEQNAFIALLLLGILALNALSDRFWCRYLCPLGALLGLLSKVALLRPVVGPACNRCAQCVGVCRVDAIDTLHGYEIVPAECIVCLDCLAACPGGGVGFRLHLRPAALRSTDPNRRQALAALASGAVGVAMLRTGVRATQPPSELIRPPGVEDERRFMARCIRCSQCMKVCPTSGLQPASFEAGLEGLWTPRLVSRLGYCAYGCNACGQICPSGAIPPLDLAQKTRSGHRYGRHRPGPLLAMGTRGTVHCVRGDVPDAAEGRASGRGDDDRRPRQPRRRPAALRATGPVHRLWYLRVPVPRGGRGSDTGIPTQRLIGRLKEMENMA
jgi:Fe-S-cluster-containing hydrogenase component 2